MTYHNILGVIKGSKYPDEYVMLSESKLVTTFIRMRHTGFVGALREKLGWTGKPRSA